MHYWKAHHYNNMNPNEFKESFEHESLFTAALTHLGFYILMFLGFINQLLFAPKVAREQNRRVIIIFYYIII